MKNYFRQYAGLPREVYFLTSIIIVNYLGNYIWPLLVFILKDQFHMSAKQIGMYISLVAFLTIFASLNGGRFADYLGRRKTFMIFNTLAAFIYMCAGLFFLNHSFLLVLLVIGSISKTIAEPSIGATYVDVTEGERRKVALSLQYLAINVGYTFGPFLAGVLYSMNPNWLKYLFVGDGLTTLFGTYVFLRYINESKPTENETKLEVKDHLFQALKGRMEVVYFLITIVLLFIVFRQHTFGLPLQMKEYDSKLGPTIYTLLLSFNTLLIVVFLPLITNLTKKNKTVWNVFMGAILIGIGFGMLGFIPSILLFVFSTFTWTIGEILMSSNTSAYIAEHSPITHRARFNSLFGIARQTASAISGIISGFIISNLGLQNLWFIMFLIAAVAAFILYRLYQTELILKKEEIE